MFLSSVFIALFFTNYWLFINRIRKIIFIKVGEGAIAKFINSIYC